MYFRVAILRRLSGKKHPVRSGALYRRQKKSVPTRPLRSFTRRINFDALGSKERQFRWILQKNMTCLSLMRVGVV